MANSIVTLPYDPEWRALDWAKQHCPSYITNATHLIPNSALRTNAIDYYFGDEGDATFFALTWA